MAREDQTQKCSSSGGGGGGSIGRSSSKKSKQKKNPQRGLGVAQLEKIRLEEQQKKDAAVVAAAAILSPPSSTKSPLISFPIPHYHHHSSYQSSSSIPFSSLPSVDNSLFRPPPLPLPLPPQNKSNNAPFSNQVANNDGIETPGHANVHRSWIPGEYILEKEISSGLDTRLPHRSAFNSPYESSTVWPLAAAPVHRAQKLYQPLSMANVPLSTSSSLSSSVLSYQIEPPSNQSYNGNFTPIRPEEEKIVGMKRSYPFSLENSTSPFNFKFPAFGSPMRVDEPASCRNGGSFNLEPRNPKFREGPSCSASIVESYSTKSIKENGGASSGDFLTLSLPTLTSLSPKFGHQSFHSCEIPNFDTLPFQGSGNDPKTKFHHPGPSIPSEQQQPFYSFFPPAKPQIGQADTTVHNCNGEARENVDLNLKL